MITKIAVVGDWFIDENWLVTRQSLYHSSQPGDAHYQVRQRHMDKRCATLCGAAAVLEVLRLHFDGDPNYTFRGYGAWAPGDDEVLQCVLCPQHTEDKKLTPFTLTSLQAPGKGSRGERLCPYSGTECSYSAELKNLTRGEMSTNRIIRCYEGFGGGRPHLLYRFDWVLPVPPDRPPYDFLTNEPNQRPDAIVIVDHGQGVITPERIDALCRWAPDAKWFVRTKIDESSWISKIGERLSLIVTDFRLAQHRKQGRRWFHGDTLGRASLELLGEMTGERPERRTGSWPEESLWEQGRPPAKAAAVLLDDNRAFAKYGKSCFALTTPPGAKQLINMARSSIFFTALVAQSLKRGLDDGSAEKWFGDECQAALECAHKWTVEASQSWNKELLHFYGDYNTALDSLKKGARRTEPKIAPTRYDDGWTLWKRSSEDCGSLTLRRNGTEREVLQVWRAEGTLKGYICVGGRKRDAINHLVFSLGQFAANRRPEHPFSCLLVSAPGWGKSYLAKCLARHFDMEYLEFSVAQMATTADVLDCFATIASLQGRTTTKTLVFIDEMNAGVEGHSVIPLFLSPLWDGLFVRDGKAHRLDPAAWVFASTDPVDSLVDPRKSGAKGSDFVSRLNGPILDLGLLASKSLPDAIAGVRGALNTEATRTLTGYTSTIYGQNGSYEAFAHDTTATLKTEQVYFMMSLLSRHWGPISRVEKAVVELFHDMLPVNGFRSMEFFAASFEQVQGGEIVAANVPRFDLSEELRRHIIAPLPWLEKGRPETTGTFVEIESIVM